ncbi:hypothetical protein BEWA_031410 [Theileria equi strain WA]|uniref:Mediator of RNA polymerase II transcription subunit 10 n=1 Tax=Theileria equi strain WA TaxID=1537102 RepID=L0AYF5_THEEQ|nr:hypothetical protein BEWA_031410 [Theileria equi strain WA]AFZ80288.1 hypothetical protein BEWA_031410 [Theileria equi strain WA]|eukprot:XP_004829954.1 hypothetical protein BEWA_031410 [Theileria equi strain WA]
MDKDEISSNDGTEVDVSSSKDKGSSPKSRNGDIVSLLHSVVEYLTKIAVICEGDATDDSASVKSLMKYMYKYERSLKGLQKAVEQNSDDYGSVIRGVVRAVDDYKNPYDWLHQNVVEKYIASGKRLDSKLEVIHKLQQELVERLNEKE